MRTTKDKILTGILTPLSWLYGAGVYVRNKLFDLKLLPSESFNVPVISVGNITVGGTGKTPHSEWLVENLSENYKLAVLSRGYKRSTKGFVLATPHSTPSTIGDEPYQIYCKYKNVARVAVCEKRREGIKKLLEIDPSINLIILDDALQHRYVQPKVSILLMDWSRPIYNDHLMPLGRLRESSMALNRVDFVIVTKVPDNATPLDLRVVKNSLQLMAYQKLFFTRFRYELPVPVFRESARYSLNLENLTNRDMAILLTGIANPRPLVKYMRKYLCRMKVCHFPDHHFFTRKDLEGLAKTFDTLNAERKIILTTEKDAVRLANNPYFPEAIKPYVYYLPISVEAVGSGNGEELRRALIESIKSRN